METIAKPNPGYRNYHCLKEAIFKAVKHNKKTVFFQADEAGERRVSREYIKRFFRTDVIKNKRPFLKKGNEKFYNLLYNKT